MHLANFPVHFDVSDSVPRLTNKKQVPKTSGYRCNELQLQTNQCVSEMATHVRKESVFR